MEKGAYRLSHSPRQPVALGEHVGHRRGPREGLDLGGSPDRQGARAKTTVRQSEDAIDETVRRRPEALETIRQGEAGGQLRDPLGLLDQAIRKRGAIDAVRVGLSPHQGADALHPVHERVTTHRGQGQRGLQLHALGDAEHAAGPQHIVLSADVLKGIGHPSCGVQRRAHAGRDQITRKGHRSPLRADGPAVPRTQSSPARAAPQPAGSTRSVPRR